MYKYIVHDYKIIIKYSKVCELSIVNILRCTERGFHKVSSIFVARTELYLNYMGTDIQHQSFSTIKSVRLTKAKKL